MELTIGILRKIIDGLSDDVILADLGIGNDRFHSFTGVKRILLLQDGEGKDYLTINSMGSHFTQEGEQKRLIYTCRYWDEDNLQTPSV